MQNEKQSKKEMLRAYKAKPLVGGVCGIVNTDDGDKILLEVTTDIAGSRNRFAFFVQSGSVPSPKMRTAPQPLNPASLRFQVFEEMPQGETQTPQEYKAELKVLFAMWEEKLGKENLY